MKNEAHKKSLSLLKQFLSETPKEEIEKILSNYDKLDIGGPTVDEYFCIIQNEFSKCELKVEDVQKESYIIIGIKNEFEIPPPPENKLINNKKYPETPSGYSFLHKFVA